MDNKELFLMWKASDRQMSFQQFKLNYQLENDLIEEPIQEPVDMPVIEPPIIEPEPPQEPMIYIKSFKIGETMKRKINMHGGFDHSSFIRSCILKEVNRLEGKQK